LDGLFAGHVAGAIKAFEYLDKIAADIRGRIWCRASALCALGLAVSGPRSTFRKGADSSVRGRSPARSADNMFEEKRIREADQRAEDDPNSGQECGSTIHQKPNDPSNWTTYRGSCAGLEVIEL
jgi:hypothetical protein